MSVFTFLNFLEHPSRQGCFARNSSVLNFAMATVQHANFIEYGRRGPRGAAQSSEESFDPELFGKSKTVSSMRGVKVLQQKEFDRIQSSLTAKEVIQKELDVKEKEKQRLKELSRKQVNRKIGSLP